MHLVTYLEYWHLLLNSCSEFYLPLLYYDTLSFHREELKQLRNEMFEIEKSLVAQVCALFLKYVCVKLIFNMYVYSSECRVPHTHIP